MMAICRLSCLSIRRMRYFWLFIGGGFCISGSRTHDQVDYMCGLVPYGSKKAFAYALSLFVFRVEKIESGEGPLLLVNYLRRQVYDFTKINCRNEELPMFVINKAFLGKVLY